MSDDLTVLRCWHCCGTGLPQSVTGTSITACYTCHGTGSVYWVNGRAIAYTPAGEKTAKAALTSAQSGDAA